MLRIDADRGKAGEHAAGTTTDGGGKNAFEPDFDACYIHDPIVIQIADAGRYFGAMQLRNPKSLIACALLLIVLIKDTLVGPHFSAFYKLELVLGPVAAAYCFWHAVKGRRALLDQSEVRSSSMLGGLSLVIAAGLTFSWPRYSYRASEVSLAVLFYAAAAFFFREALHERRSDAAKNSS